MSKQPASTLNLALLVLAICVSCSNSSPPASGTQPNNIVPTPAAATGGAGAAASSAGAQARAGQTAQAGRAPTSAGVGGVSTPTRPATAGAAGGTIATAQAGAGGSVSTVQAGAGMAGSAGTMGRPTPTTRNPKYMSLAPAMGEPLPRSNMGMWNYIDIAGAQSRDGSSAGFYYKFSQTGSKNLVVYLVGGGVCPDNSFCNINPANKSQSLTAEGIGAGAANALAMSPDAEPQDPSGERWQSGIFKNDPANPVKDWNMVFIPYVTGDVFFGSRPNGTIENVNGSFQFVGKTNMQKFFERIIPTFKDAEIALMAGSSAGGIGTLLNATYFADGFIDQGNGARVLIVDDAGPFFEDEYLEVCIQKRYRDIFALNDSFPKDCTGCFNPDGGGLAKGILTYLLDKYPNQLLGGLVDSNEDEIMKFFFSEGQMNCMFIDNPLGGLAAYPDGLYPKALTGLLNIAPPTSMSSYIWEGTLHQNLFQTASGDRFYEKNGLDKTVAEWLTGLIAGAPERIGVVK
jgi:hypothetical protein